MKRKVMAKAAGSLLCAALLLGAAGCGSAGQSAQNASEGTSAVNETESTAQSAQAAVVEADNDTGEAVTLTIGVWSDDESKRLEKAFEGIEGDLGIAIEFLKYPSDSDFWDNIPAQIAAGTAPDIISCTNEHYLQYIDQGLFEPLDEYVESGVISLEGTWAKAMDAWKINDVVYGIPYALNPGVFIVNDSMWKEFGLGDSYPATWDEVLDICKKVKEEHDMPALCLNVQEYHLTNIALSFGGGWDFGKNIGAKENAEALQFLIDAYREGYIVTPTELGLGWDGAVMIQQSALFSTGGAWYQASFAAEAPDIALKYLPVPKGGNGNGGDKLYEAVVDVTEVIPAKEEYFDLYKEKVPALADLVSYLDASTPFSYPTQSKKFADSLINLMQETMFDESSTMTGQQIVEQLEADYGTD
jgi:multiple sugar transport system substrate-binding protein